VKLLSEIERKHIGEIIEALMKAEKLTRRKAWKITKSVCKKYSLDDMPTNVMILEQCDKNEKDKLNRFLMTKPVRTSSGVATVTVVPKPSECPGKCIYCPRGEDSPQSYSGTEPAIMRARHNDYNPYRQVKNRLEQYEMMGHPTDKIQVIIIGGTFLSMNDVYKKSFMKSIFDALNGMESEDIETAKKRNENAKNRCIGIIIETRPDFCKEKHIDEMLEYGVTMVEIGVQSIYDDVLEKVGRMHTIEDVKRATLIAKNAGLKVNYHIMPGLPGMDRRREISQFKSLFDKDDFKPDALKIYPTLVIDGTELYDMWKKGDYETLGTKEAVDLLSDSMEFIPKYCRIVRMQRTMSADKIESGVDKSNLRELVENEAEKKGIEVKEIRYREVGRSEMSIEGAEMMRCEYDASRGKEIFLSFENRKKDSIFGFIRVRIPKGSHRKEIDRNTAIVRELHVYGPAVRIGKDSERFSQHKGFGTRLLKEAERIAKEEFGKNKMVVISGVGVREYYYKRGYKAEGPYVSKRI